MCPIVPMFTCGFVRSYFAFAIPHFLPLAVTLATVEVEPMSGIEPETSSLPRTRSEPLEKLALAGGFEPPTHCLQGSCSATELRQHRQNFTLITKPYRVKEFESLAASGGRPRSRKLPRRRRR